MAEIVGVIEGNARVAISSDPGSGKSTRIPPALVRAGHRVLVLEPRRISALSLATYISEQQGTKVGERFGYQVRGDSKRTKDTQALFVTEALLPKFLDSDPFLSEWDVVVLDEFHERHLHTDLAWALLNKIQRELRPELKLVLLSATLNLAEVRKRWPDVSVLHIENPPHPLHIEQMEVAKSLSDPHALRRALVDTLTTRRFEGDVLVFLPGTGEIRRAHEDLQRALRGRTDLEIMELYGAQSLDEQRRVLKRSDRKKIILATNVAESSITIDGVRTVIDSGLERVAWANSKSGLTELKTERISKSSATQRAGRAARQAAGTCIRLWSSSEQSALDDFALAEIHRSDLSETLYSVLSSGWNPLGEDFVWFERPQDQRLQDSWQRLLFLKLVTSETSLAPERAHLAQYPTGVRGAIYLEELHRVQHEISALDLFIAAMVSSPEGRTPTDAAYLRDVDALARHFKVGRIHPPKDFDLGHLSEAQRLALGAAAPDRVFERRSAGSASVKLQSGRGATLASPHTHAGEKYGVAVLLREADPDASIALAAVLDKKEFQRLSARPEEKAKIASLKTIDPFAPELETIQKLLARAEIFRALLLPSFDLKPLIQSAAESLAEMHPKRDLDSLQGEILAWVQGMSPQSEWRRFESACPTHYTLPRTGRTVALQYQNPERVELHARLQEFLGVTEHPRIVEGHIALTLVLLSPAMRPIQITQRLEDFWTGSYVQIRKEMKSRYPKHDW
ncbi:MAG TPA: ATP-dependent helicase C-terminal domain-containing protein [Bdellovibrionota bacterium]|nr:ATP-dependent helicase C-terminal domain-containing protein [Bdellovibrionota bacterium]